MFTPLKIWWLANQLKSSSLEKRQKAVLALGQLSGPTVEPLIQNMMSDEAPLVRLAVVDALSSRDDHRFVELFVDALIDSSRQVRSRAADALKTHGQPKWQDWFKGDNDDFIRLRDSNDAATAELGTKLLNMLSDNETEGIAFAALSLGQLRERRAIDPLRQLLQHSAPTVRAITAAALGEIGDAESADRVVAILADRDSSVRMAGAAALRALGQPKWQDWFQGDDDDFGRLGRSGDDAAETIATSVGESFSNAIGSKPRMFTVDALLQLRAIAAIEPLAKSLTDAPLSEVPALIERFGNSHSRLCAVSLVKFLESREQVVKPLEEKYTKSTYRDFDRDNQPAEGGFDPVWVGTRAGLGVLACKRARMEVDEIFATALAAIIRIGNKDIITSLLRLQCALSSEWDKSLRDAVSRTIDVLKTDGSSVDPRCDICMDDIPETQGYMLTTRQVVVAPSYWEVAFRGAGDAIAAMSKKEISDLYNSQLTQQCGQVSGWLVCNKCIAHFSDVDALQSQEYANAFWKSGADPDYRPPESGPVDASEAATAAQIAWNNVTGTSSP